MGRAIFDLLTYSHKAPSVMLKVLGQVRPENLLDHFPSAKYAFVHGIINVLPMSYLAVLSVGMTLT